MKEDKPYPKMTKEEWRKRTEREDRKEWFISGMVAFVSFVLGVFLIHKILVFGVLLSIVVVLLIIVFTLFMSRYVMVNKEVI